MDIDIKFNNLLKTNEYLSIIDKNEIINGPKKYILQYKNYINIYNNLFKEIIHKNSENEQILDFGCGPAFSVYVGKQYYNLNIRGIDIHIGSGNLDFIYKDIHKILDIEKNIDYYDGNNIYNYQENSFSIILCFWSLLFDYSNDFGKNNYIYPENNEGKILLIKKFKNLLLISKPNCKWIISPKKFWTKNISNLFNTYNNKNIIIKIV